MGQKYAIADTVDDTRRIGMVKEIFSTITGRYDLLNHVLSLRRDIAWRRFAVRRMCLHKTSRFLDVAAGTCDLAIEAAVHHPGIHVTGLDFAQPMLDQGRKKISARGLSGRIHLCRGDALRLPFAKDSFHAAAMAFGIRNIPDKHQALRELRRVVAPEGHVLILELSLPQTGWFRRFYDLYLNRLLPRVAGAISPNPAAYQYLADSIMDFPSVTAFRGIIQDAGWVDVRVYPLTLGICRLFVGRKPGGSSQEVCRN
jgi:demethylmenaquinone methyltransferase / 2-methoxy-6-polyprenyl-1,4-benzoquinol methylase